MRFKILKKLSISLIICLSALTPFADAKTISTDKYDLDLNGTKEWIQVNVKKVDEYTSLPEYIEIKYNVPGSSVPSSYGRLDIPGEDKLAYNNIKVVDINLNDEQKEILLMLRGTEYFYNEIQLYTLTNKKLRYIGKIESISVLVNVGVNKKTNTLDLNAETDFPMQSIYYRKFIVSGGKLKETTPNEVNISYFREKIVLTAQKSINVYSNTKFNEKAFVIKAGEKITFISANKKGAYAKVRNSSRKTGFIQITETPEKYAYALKQYPNVSIEGNDGSPFKGANHWN
jgi:hypothetical protein